MAGTVEKIDGRTARSIRTKAAIVDACLTLVDAGDPRPTAPRVAEKAGVSVRSIFQHFADLESLFAAVGDEAMSRLRGRAIEVDRSLPIGERIRSAVAQRASLLEDLTPLRRSVAANAGSSPAVADRLRAGHALFRDELARAFGAEVGDDAQLMDAIDAVLSWPTWDQLRTLIGLDRDDAAAVLERIVRSLLRVTDE